MKRPKPSLREQLLTARSRLRRQIDVLNAGPRGPNMSFQAGMRERLEAMVEDIEDQIANFEAEANYPSP